MGSICCSDQKRVFDEASDKVHLSQLSTAMDKLQIERSRMIDAELKREATINEKVIKILLLGASDSGKSTIAKQMRILHTDGFSAAERIHYKYMVHSNYIDSFYHIAKGIYQLQVEIPPTERELVNMFEQSYYGQFMMLDEQNDLLKMIIKFLNYKCVQRTCEKIAKFYVPDNTTYLLENATRILQPDYIPTTDDIIHARASTKGIYEIIFTFRQFTIRLIDVGGQKTERRKWIHCFEGVSAILFIISLSCYNQELDEDNKINQMVDTIELFKRIYRNRFLRKSSFILFLNKRDIFEKKIQHVPLQNYYPGFEDKIRPEMTDMELYNEAIEYVKNMFMTIRGHDKRPLYTHVTNATDTRNVDFVFNATCDIVIGANMKTAGML